MPIFRKDDQVVLFIHVPKTGGTAIEHSFRNSGWTTRYLDGKTGPGTWNDVRRCTPQHMHAEMLDMLFQLDRFTLIFMVVRDPLTRLQSEYLWRQRGEDFAVDGSSVQRWVSRSLRRYRRNPFLFDNHLRPQAEFRVRTAKVFRFEDGLDHVVRELNRTGDLGLDTNVPRTREGHTTTRYASRDVELTPRTMRMAREFYEEDFEVFGY